MKKHIKRILLLGIILVILSFLILNQVISYQYKKVTIKQEQSIVVNQGDSLNTIANKLNIKERQRFFFVKLALLKNRYKDVKTGEFLILENSSIKEVLDIISSNNTIDYKITIIEGYQKYQMENIFYSIKNLTGDIPKITKEGIYMPDTYLYKTGDTKESIFNRANKAMNEYLENSWQKRDKNIPIKSKEEALILASVIERETGKQDEYRLVSSVFMNRLNKGMKLQADSTAIYGITNGNEKFNRKLYKKDLAKENKYNTYLINRLPITPICNPGKKAIDSVMHPANTSYLYFVADGTGGHAFAKTGKEHQRNVVKWRKIKNNF